MAIYSSQRAEAKKKNDEIFNLQTEQVNKTADAGIKKINTAYDDQQRAVAVQKLINERKVAESMANLGLTDSGINRTQQTAVQLSAANAGYNLNRQKQADIAAYNLERDNKLSTIEQNRIASAADIDATFDGMEAEYSAASAATIAAQEKASQIISHNNAVLSRNFKGTFAENKISFTDNLDGTVTYLDRNTGYQSKFTKTTNPFTNDDNAKVIDAYGAFSNGYQPKGVKGIGKFDVNKNKNVISAGTAYIPEKEKTQNVFRITDGKGNLTFWLWKGEENRYVEVVPVDGNGKETAYKEGNTRWGEVLS